MPSPVPPSSSLIPPIVQSMISFAAGIALSKTSRPSSVMCMCETLPSSLLHSDMTLNCSSVEMGNYLRTITAANANSKTPIDTQRTILKRSSASKAGGLPRAVNPSNNSPSRATNEADMILAPRILVLSAPQRVCLKPVVDMLRTFHWVGTKEGLVAAPAPSGFKNCQRIAGGKASMQQVSRTAD